MFRVLILTEAGDGIGFGHLTRCQALMKSFIKSGGRCDLLLHYSGEYGQDDTNNIRLVEWRSEVDKICVIAGDYDLVLFDSYLIDAFAVSEIERYFPNSAFIDDYNRMDYPVDLLINPNTFGDSIRYNRDISRIAAGKDYVILREEIRNGPKFEAFSEDLTKIAITLGGSDTRNLLPALIELTSDKFAITALAGTDAYSQKLASYSSSSCKILGHRSASQMRDIFIDSDLVISAAGQTLNELAYLGVPTISICVDKDQEYNLEYFHKVDFIPDKIFWNGDNLSDKIYSSIEFYRDREVRTKASNMGKGLIDGKGVERIREFLMSYRME